MRVVLFSTDKSAFGLVEHFQQDDQLVLMVSPANRQTSPKVEELGMFCSEHRVPISVQPKDRGVGPFVESLRELQPDVGISWFYSQILTLEMLNLFPRGVLNMHGGKIPEYRGASVLQWCIIDGEEEVGVTWHSMVEEVDAGPIWSRSVVRISSEETAWEVRGKVVCEGIRLFQEFWPRFKDGNLVPVPVPGHKGKTWPQRRLADSEIPLNLSRRQLKDFLRALCPPWPRPYLVVDRKRYEVIEILEGDSRKELDPVRYKLSDGSTVLLGLKASCNEQET